MKKEFRILKICFFILFINFFSITLFCQEYSDEFEDKSLEKYLKTFSSSTVIQDEFEVINPTYSAKVKDRIYNDILKISDYFNMNTEKLYKYRKRGYGYIEIVRMILISKGANVNFEDIVKMRIRKKTFAEISEKLKLDNISIKNKAKEILLLLKIY